MKKRRSLKKAHLGNCWIQIIHDHQHHGGCLTCATWVLINGVSSKETEGNAHYSCGGINEGKWGQMLMMTAVIKCLTSNVVWDRNGTCICVHTAAALEQTQVQVWSEERRGNNAGHFSVPPRGDRDL